MKKYINLQNAMFLWLIVLSLLVMFDFCKSNIKEDVSYYTKYMQAKNNFLDLKRYNFLFKDNVPQKIESSFLNQKLKSNDGLMAWKGGAKMPLLDLKKTIMHVASTFNLKNEKIINFMLEIAAVESDFGLIVKQSNGNALSPWQMQPSTWNYLNKLLSSKYPDTYKKLNDFYKKNKSEYWNRTENIPYACASSLLFINFTFPDKTFKNIGTITERAKIWKQYYNTPKGKGTIKRYNQKAWEYVWNNHEHFSFDLAQN